MNLHEKLIAVRKQITYIQKGTYNQKQNFKYVSSTNILEHIRPLLDDNGILIVPRIMAYNARLHAYSKSSGYFTELIIEYEVINVEKPDDKITIKWYAQGLDQSEKGVGKALTYGEKYLFLKLFNVPTDVDDPDSYEEKKGKKSGEGPKSETDTPTTHSSVELVSTARDYYAKLIDKTSEANALGFYKHAKVQSGLTPHKSIETGDPTQITKVIEMLKLKLGE